MFFFFDKLSLYFIVVHIYTLIKVNLKRWKRNERFCLWYFQPYLVINVAAGVISFISESDDNQLSAANQNTNTVVSAETTAAEAVNDAKNETKPETQTENSEETETPNVPMHESAEW